MIPKLTALFALVVSLFGVYQALGFIRSDILFNRAETEVSFWGRDEYLPTPITVRNTSGAIAALIQRQPGHPQYLVLQASAFAWRAYWDKGGISAGFASRALDSQLAAVESRPAHRQSWAGVVEYANRVPEKEAQVHRAQEQLVALQKWQ